VCFKKIIFVFLVGFISINLSAQKDSIKPKKIKRIARFQKWKVPIAWSMVAIPVYYYQLNNNEYKRFRRAFRARSNGFQDEFTNDLGESSVSVETLQRAQEQLRENRDLSLLTTVILYVLQIVEASVNAHLLQFNTDDNLTLRPTFINDPVQIETPRVGLTLKYNF